MGKPQSPNEYAKGIIAHELESVNGLDVLLGKASDVTVKAVWKLMQDYKKADLEMAAKYMRKADEVQQTIDTIEDELNRRGLEV